MEVHPVSSLLEWLLKLVFLFRGLVLVRFFGGEGGGWLVRGGPRSLPITGLNYGRDNDHRVFDVF